MQASRDFHAKHEILLPTRGYHFHIKKKNSGHKVFPTHGRQKSFFFPARKRIQETFLGEVILPSRPPAWFPGARCCRRRRFRCRLVRFGRAGRVANPSWPGCQPSLPGCQPGWSSPSLGWTGGGGPPIGNFM